MKTVVIDGVTYTKVSELARTHQYTTDYLGQLCRSGKVEAELVGRAWYANETSLLAHKEGRYKIPDASTSSHRVPEKTPPTKLQVHSKDRTSHIQVHPRISKKTVKVVETVKQVQAPSRRQPATPLFYEHAAPTASLYIPDTSDLLPQTAPRRARFDRDHEPSTGVPEVKLTVKPAEAEEIKVKRADTPFKLSFSRVPEVSLRGPLSITDLDDDSADDENFLVSETDVRALQPRTIRPQLPGQRRVPLKRAQARQAPLATKAAAMHAHSSTVVAPKPTSAPKAEVSAVQFTPASVQTPGTKRPGYVVPVVALVAILLALVLVGLDTTLTTDGSVVTQELHFNLASLLSVWQSLSSW